jgi:hypothetical protein
VIVIPLDASRRAVIPGSGVPPGVRIASRASV